VNELEQTMNNCILTNIVG